MTTTQIKPTPEATTTQTPAAVPALSPPPDSAAAITPEPQTPEPRKFTVAEYYRMAEGGILGPEERVQLIEGEIIVMPPIGPLHAGSLDGSTSIFYRTQDDRFYIRTQNPLRLDDGSEPEPDIALVRPRADRYTTAHPTPADTFAVIEVSNSTLEYYRNHKAHIYGRAGVAQTLVLNLPEDCIENFTEPGPQGYGRHTIHRRGDKISLVALPDLELAVEDLLPPLPAAASEESGDDGG